VIGVGPTVSLFVLWLGDWSFDLDGASSIIQVVEITYYRFVSKQGRSIRARHNGVGELFGSYHCSTSNVYLGRIYQENQSLSSFAFSSSNHETKNHN